jgi:opacity protein-like surface antigen
MKTKIFISALLLAINIHSQVREIESRSCFKQGDFEFNFSLNLGAGFTSFQNSENNEGSYYNDHGERPFIFLLSAAIGYCVIDGLAVEPEFDINLITDAEMSTTILLNATYNFNIPKKSIYPFIKLGYGISNFRSDYYYYDYNSNDNSLSTGVVNIGAGLKIAYSSGMALKLEINYKRYDHSSSYTYYYYNQSTYEEETRTADLNTTVDAITLSIGYSIMF